MWPTRTIRRSARELLDAAGYKDTDGDGIREDKQGKPIKLRLWAASAKPEYASAAKFITGWLEDVGLDIDMQVMEDGALTDRQFNYKGDKFAPDFDLFIWGWETGEYDPNFLLSLFTTGQIESWSDCNFSSAEYDGMYKTQDYDADEQSRLATVHEMQQLLYEAASVRAAGVSAHPRGLQLGVAGVGQDPGAQRHDLEPQHLHPGPSGHRVDRGRRWLVQRRTGRRRHRGGRRSSPLSWSS